MPKQVIVIMEEHYPFGECEEITNENTRVLVRKIYQVSVQQRAKLMEKVNVLRRLKNEHMIKIESVLEEEESIHFLFEYIPIKLQTWISNINDQFIENFRDQLIKFSAFLANNCIKIDFQLKNIGMDQNYGAKYFLDLDFQLDPSINRQKLKSLYIREITNLFKPYILTNQSQDTERQRIETKNQQSSNIVKNSPENIKKVYDTSISPPTNRPNNNTNSSSKNKEKALAQYYQDVNMSVDSENEKILQEFMDVLDNEGEEEFKPPPPPPMSKPQPPPQPQFSSPTQQRSQNTQNLQFAKQTSQPAPFQQHSNSFHQSNPHQQNQYPPQPASSRQLPNEYSNQYAPQFHSQNAINGQSNQAQTARANNGNTGPTMGGSMGRGKSELKQAPQMEMWRESADLQNRVKNAIEKSMSVIKRFKAIKENSLI